ncbi:MAG TPA: ATP-binding protein [Rhizomicrobium sp.]|nr:ATP-binding protein [Rhizomicrobium sp.]
MADLAAPISLAGWRSSLRSGRIRPGAIAGLGALGLSVFLLFALGAVVALNQNALRSRFGWIQHTDDVLLQVASLQQLLQRMESNIRAYGLSGDPGHVAAWPQQKADSEARLARLAALMADNPAQEARLAAVRPLIADWSARWSVYATHPSPALLPGLRAELARDLREHPARRFHGALNALAGVERMLLKQREETAARLVTSLEWLSVLLALAAPTLGMVGISLLLREGNRVRQRELQMQLEHSQRLGLMGETASMLAHELNQPLTAARNYLSVARRTQEGAPAEVIDKAEQQIARAAAILQRLRGFIEKRDNGRQQETCAGLVADALMLLGTIDSRVMLHTDVQAGLPALMVDRIQIQQVLVNLMRNAIEAMAASPRREMWLTVGRADDGRILFRLRDSGPGLSPVVAPRLFQPFTSTKAEGMGVGLSICRRIVQDHGGEIWTESPAEGGACFCFALPAARA